MDDAVTGKLHNMSAEDFLLLSRQKAEATRRSYESLAECLFNGRDSELVLSDLQRLILSQLLRHLPIARGDAESW